MVAGAANGADTEMLRRNRVDLAVAVARDQNLESTLAAHEGQQIVLPMPDPDNDRKVELRVLDEPLGLDCEARRHPHQAKIFGRHDPDCPLERTRADETLDQG